MSSLTYPLFSHVLTPCSCLSFFVALSRDYWPPILMHIPISLFCIRFTLYSAFIGTPFHMYTCGTNSAMRTNRNATTITTIAETHTNSTFIFLSSHFQASESGGRLFTRSAVPTTSFVLGERESGMRLTSFFSWWAYVASLSLFLPFLIFPKCIYQSIQSILFFLHRFAWTRINAYSLLLPDEIHNFSKRFEFSTTV